MLNFIQMPIVWTVLIIAFIVIEGLTLGLTSIWFAAGSLVALVLSLFNVPIYIQIVGFLGTATILLIYTRPIAKDFLKIGGTKTNADGLIGEVGQVIIEIAQFKTGQVKVKGQIWTAIDIEKKGIEENSSVEIMEIEGVKLIVRKI
ncbi:MAG: NfeD family protein [Acidaminobacteraceae bacterium]